MNLVGELLEPRCQILVEYAKWIALSAVKAGCPIRAREPVYPGGRGLGSLHRSCAADAVAWPAGNAA